MDEKKAEETKAVRLTARECALLNAILDQAFAMAEVSGGEEYEPLLEEGGNFSDLLEEVRQLALKVGRETK